MTSSHTGRFRPPGFYKADSGFGFAYGAWIRLKASFYIENAAVGFTYFLKFRDMQRLRTDETKVQP